MGCWLALAYQREPRGLLRSRALAVSLLVVGVLGIAASELFTASFPGWHRAVFFGIPASFIVAGTLLAECTGMSVRQRFALLLGAASYSIYLVHQLLMQAAFKLVARLLPTGLTALVAGWSLAFGLIFVVGIAVHWYFELPVTRRLRNTLHWPTRAGQQATGATS